MSTAVRERFITKLRRTMRAARVGRLMLSELKSWEEFLEPETTNFDLFDLRDLRADQSRFRKGVSREIKKFCNENFDGMTDAVLEKLYLRVKERLGLEMPLTEFEKCFAKLKPDVIAGNPRHCTVNISLWGLQLQFPEDFLSKDIKYSLNLIHSSGTILTRYRDSDHEHILCNQEEIRAAVRANGFASRSCLISCFNLIEASLNGLAWDYAQDVNRLNHLSGKQKSLIEDGPLREKLLKYPEIMTGRPLWDENDVRIRHFVDNIKPYRDSLVHASPFSKPERYGGIDKLEFIYRIDGKKAYDSAMTTISLLKDLFHHINGDEKQLPSWLRDLITAVQCNTGSSKVE